jgi:dTDP-4-dehydrorhamnose 3,5-epimerase
VIFTALPLAGAYQIELECHADERGFFARLWCGRELSERGLRADFVQSSISFNKRQGTLRGLHYQRPPLAETKLVRCVRGADFDVIVDLRRDSPTFGRWQCVEITAENRRAVYIPAGMAHGFQTLVDETELLYEITPEFSAEHSVGVRWNDPQLNIAWPDPERRILSDRDSNLPCLE